jgi:hypothetical protein
VHSKAVAYFGHDYSSTSRGWYRRERKSVDQNIAPGRAGVLVQALTPIVEVLHSLSIQYLCHLWILAECCFGSWRRLGCKPGNLAKNQPSLCLSAKQPLTTARDHDFPPRTHLPTPTHDVNEPLHPQTAPQCPFTRIIRTGKNHQGSSCQCARESPCLPSPAPRAGHQHQTRRRPQGALWQGLRPSIANQVSYPSVSHPELPSLSTHH